MGSTGQVDGGIPAQVQTLHLSDLLAQLKWPFCSYGDPLSAFTSTVKYSLRHSQLKTESTVKYSFIHSQLKRENTAELKLERQFFLLSFPPRVPLPTFYPLSAMYDSILRHPSFYTARTCRRRRLGPSPGGEHASLPF